MSKRIHLAIRISDEMYGISQAVIRHNSTAFKHGMVWLGKPYRALGAGLADKFNEQIAQGIPTFMYIIYTDRSITSAHRTTLQGVSMKTPPDKELIPRFYKELRILSRMKTWFKVEYIDGFRLDEFPELDEANTSHEVLLNKHPNIPMTKLPGYFLLEELEPELES